MVETKKKYKLLASSHTRLNIEKMISEYYFGSKIRLEPDTENGTKKNPQWKVFLGDRPLLSDRIRFTKGRYRFEEEVA